MVEVLLTVVIAVVGLLTPKLATLVSGKIQGQKLGIIFTVARQVVVAIEEEIKGEKKGAEKFEEAKENINEILKVRGIKAENILIQKAIDAAVFWMHRDQEAKEGFSQPIETE